MKPQKQAALRSVQSVSMCTVAVSLYHHSLWSENVCGVIFPSCVCVCVFFTSTAAEQCDMSTGLQQTLSLKPERIFGHNTKSDL